MTALNLAFLGGMRTTLPEFIGDETAGELINSVDAELKKMPEQQTRNGGKRLHVLLRK